MKMFCKLKNKPAFVSFLILMMTFGLFFGCSNLYQSKETVSLTFNFSFSRSEPQNEKVLKVDLISKNGIILQQRETVFSTETVNVEFSKVLVNSEIYVSVELYNDNELQLTGKSELTKIKPGKNVIKLTLIQYDDEIPDDNPEGGTETPETGGNTGSESGGTGETGGEGTTPDNDKITPDNAATVIAAYTIEGHYDITIEGQFSSIEILTSIANAINENENISSVRLDLSKAGLGGVPNGAFYNCIKLTNIILPDNEDNGYGTSYGGVESINQNAFAGCTNLVSITLPLSLNYIDPTAFDNCTSLATVNYYGGNSDLWKSLIGDNGDFDACKINYNN